VDVLKLSPTGAAAWADWVGTRNQLSRAAPAVDAAGDSFVAGAFTGPADFDPGPKAAYASSGPAEGGFVLKLTAAGKFGWVSPFVGQPVDATTYGYSSAQSVTLDGGGNVDVGGYYGGPVDFNRGPGRTPCRPAAGRSSPSSPAPGR
jgi:hypothetical protein